MKMFIKAAVCLSLAFSATSARAFPVLHVDASAGIGGDGSSWEAAMARLEWALDAAAQPGSDVTEIWVAAGSYAPAESGGDVTSSFVLVDGVSLYGGFAGWETQRDQRDPVTNVSLLTGDIEGDGSRLSFHVLIGNDLSSATVIDGFTVTLGIGDDGSGAGIGGVGGAGAGMLLINSSPVINNCYFHDNKARIGSAVYVQGGDPVFNNCNFEHNWSARSGEGGGIYAIAETGSMSLTVNDSVFLFNAVTQGHYATGHGAGIYSGTGVNLNVTDTYFEGNFTWHNNSFGNGTTGGGITHLGDSAVITNCDFIENYSNLGAGIYTAGDMTIADCRFRGNKAVHAVTCAGFDCPGEVPDITSGYGGGVFGYIYSNVNIINSTIAGNWSAKRGGGAVLTGTITNSILWANRVPSPLPGEDPILPVRIQVEGAVEFFYSDIEGLLQTIPGEDPINPDDFPTDFELDPMFVETPQVSELGGLIAAGDVHLLPGSPCIDAGDNTAVPANVTHDLDGLQRFVDDPDTADTGNGSAPIVDLGSFEFQVDTPCTGDLNNDGSVDQADLGILLAAYQNNDSGDIDGDGDTDQADLGALLALYGNPCN
ncbi:MAG TPA: hypothetical protein ENJ06_00775 [Phycisphaeraceae bacterium]|nr:hypothetical protein [Phycisphaeraceae bacterium]